MKYSSLILLLATLVLSQMALHPMASADDWVKEENGELSFRIRGEVVDSQGKPTERLSIELDYQADVTQHGDDPKAIEFDGNQFEFWIPIRGPGQAFESLPSIHVSSNGEHAYPRIAPNELREVAMNGLKVSLQKPSRTVEVSVVDESMAVPFARVQASLFGRNRIRARSDGMGIARIQLLPDQELHGLMAWTNNHRIAGFGFDRGPTRDPSLDRYELELDACQELTIRFVDESDSPVQEVPFTLYVATPPPHINYIGIHEPSSMKSDSKGESHYRWFPRWDAHHFYVELSSKYWTTDDQKGEAIQGIATFGLKKTRFDERKRIVGKVVGDEKNLAGYYVTLYSFQGESEKRSDVLTAFTNPHGEFEMDVLPDATYCAMLTDARKTAVPIDLIPFDSKSGTTSLPTLKIADGEPVEFVATIGPDRKPYANLTIGLIKNHDFSWLEKGEKRQGRTSSQWWITTDRLGRATTSASLGELEISIHQPLWKTKQTLNVEKGNVNRVELHRIID